MCVYFLPRFQDSLCLLDAIATVYTAAQASKAIIPKDVGGPWGKRIGVSVGGTLDWALVVGAYVTGRVSSSDWDRYSLVVLNWYDNSTGTWDPQSVSTTIEFRGAQVCILLLLLTDPTDSDFRRSIHSLLA